jgi:small subunit ribosomal protein S6e
MANFQFIVSDPATRKAYKIEIDQNKATGLVGKIVGEKFNGDILGLSGYELQITGGTDKDGFPMHPSVHGPGRKSLVLAYPPGFHPRIKGQRRRKMIRGNAISLDIVQINCKVTKAGTKPLHELFAKEKKEEKEEEKPVEKKEEKKPEKEEKSKKEGEVVPEKSKS